MKIDLLLEKREQRQVKILRQLILAGGKMELGLLQKQVGLSKTAFDQYLSELVEGHLFEAKKVVCQINDNTLTVQLADTTNLEELIALLVVESIKFRMLEYLLLHHEFSTIQLVNEFALSDSSVFRKIKELNQLLVDFDLKIKNGRLIGEELQIRYFYYQLYQFVAPVYQPAYLESSAVTQNFIFGLERVFDTRFSKQSIQKIEYWLHLTKRRLVVKNSRYTKLREKMKTYLNDPFYLKTDQVITIYFSRTASEVNKHESMLFFIFLVSFSLFDEETFYQYDLIRSKKMPTPVLDIYIRETILLHYRPRRLAIELEKKIGVQLSQINSEAYFFKGKIEIYEQAHMLEKQMTLLGKNHQKLLHELVQVALEQLESPSNAHDSLQTYLTISYASILAMMDFYIAKTIHVGIDLTDLPVFSEPFYQLLQNELRPIAGVVVAPYQEQEQYDLVLTTRVNQFSSDKQKKVYCLSEFESMYDMLQIKRLIVAMKQEKN